MAPCAKVCACCYFALCASVLEIVVAMDPKRPTVGSFLAVVRRHRNASAQAEQAASLLEQRAREVGSSQMEALALRVGSVAASTLQGSPKNLEDVKELLRGMLASAKEAHANDVGLHEFCTSETQRAKDGVTNYGDRAEKATADVDKLSAEIDQATAKIADLHAEVLDAQKQLMHAAENRSKEKADYDSGKGELESIETKYRDALAKLSLDDTAARATLEHDAEIALQRRIKMETTETSANLAFERAQREGNEKVKLKSKQIKHEEHALVNMQSQLVDNKQDLTALDEQLSAAKLYDAQIAKKCVVPTGTHAERTQRRQQEIDSLKDAYRILAADDLTT